MRMLMATDRWPRRVLRRLGLAALTLALVTLLVGLPSAAGQIEPPIVSPIDLSGAHEPAVYHVPQPHANGQPPWLVDVHFVTEQLGYGVTEFGGVYRTVDAGDHWEQLLYLNGIELARVAFPDRDTGFAIGRGNCPSLEGYSSCYRGEPLVLATRDGGQSWEVLDPSVPAELDVCPGNDVKSPRPGCLREDFFRLRFTFVSAQVGFAQDNPAFPWHRASLQRHFMEGYFIPRTAVASGDCCHCHPMSPRAPASAS
ncbi:MAG: hypothetical protein HY329_23015 [Chloroflexi bacterium]|nr:hypothetical protein [Chloroflexota bacterium]